MKKEKMVTCWKRMLASLLVAALVFTSCEWPIQANAQEVNQTEETEDSTEDAAEGAAASEENAATEEIESSSEETAEPGGELEDLRDEMSKQFLMDDGTIAAVQYDTDVHYQDEEGNWQEIDNSLTSEDAEDSDDASGYSNKEGKVKYKFAKNANANFLVRVMQGKYHIFFSAKNKQKQAAGAKVLEMDAESSESVETVADNGSESTEEGEESDEQESATTVAEEESENTESVENGTEKAGSGK